MPPKESHKTARLVFFYLVGLTILGVLIYRMPLADVGSALAELGGSLVLVLLAGPLIMAATASSLYLLCARRVGWRKLFHLQLIADSYNQILPLAGMGGDPLKIARLSKDIGAREATHVVVIDRVLHMIPGPLFSAIGLPLLVLILPLEPAWTTSFLLVGGLLGGLSLVLLAVVFSRAPGKVTDFFIRKLIPAESAKLHRQARLPFRDLLYAFLAKSTGQVVVVGEIWLILTLLGLPATLPQVLAISLLVTMAAVFLFVIPQQVGVNEAALTELFTMLGLSPTLGLALGLCRRARQTFWPLFGIAVHGFEKLVRR